MLKTITVCKMQSIETIIKIKAKIVNIVKIDVVKTKFPAMKQRNVKIIILLIFRK